MEKEQSQNNPKNISEKEEEVKTSSEQKLENSEIIVEGGLGHLMHEENPNKIFEHLMSFYNKIKSSIH